uniref:tryptophan halogenase family protein n=1 Tax=Shewanella gaetbuli TaxID=220752 RepID=UPI003B597862
MKNNNKQKIVIVGGGTAGWMTAAAFARLLVSDSTEVTLIESEQISTVGVGEATVPHLKFFNHKLGINEDLFMEQCHATYKLGIEFVNWSKHFDSYIHPFADLGEPIHGVPFHQVWLQYQQQNPQSSLSDFSLAIQASYLNKFSHPTTETSSVYSSYSYAYHIDATSYAHFLSSFAQENGVTRIEGIVKEVTTSETGDIDKLILDNGNQVTADLFIDCSGFRSLLLGQTLGVSFEDWSEYLPCDRAIAAPSARKAVIKPYTRSIAKEAGWQWQIPLTHRTGNGYVYSSKFQSDEDALASFIKQVDGPLESEPKILKFQAGKRSQSWQSNCVAIGLSSGFLEPLESTSIYLIQSAIMKLIDLLPHDISENQKLLMPRTEFNRYMNNELIKIRDFLILHYHITGRTDTQFWQYCSNMKVPESLMKQLSLFKATGQVKQYQHGMFHEPSWLAVYYGQGLKPNQIDPRVSGLVANGVLALFPKLAQEVQDAANSMTSHESALQSIKDRRSKNQCNQKQVLPTLSLYGRY